MRTTWPALDLDARPGVSLDDLDDRLALVLDGHDIIAIEHDSASHWRVFVDDDASRTRVADAVATDLAGTFDVSSVDVEDEGWALKVQQTLGAIEVGDLVVAPPWDLPAGDRQVIVIEPSMGFGTGHHQSTRLCLRILQELDPSGLEVIDAGTGSGVLAIAACLRGASHARALDYDADAIAGAADNARRNGVSDRVEAVVADLGTWSGRAAPLVFANLTAFLLRRFASTIHAMVAPNGCLVLSGFTADQVPLVTDVFPGWTVVSRLDEDDWVGLLLRR